jgi:hypothetical protein
MRRLALLGTAIAGLAIGIAACTESVTQPRARTAPELNPSFTTTTPASDLACQNAVYPTSLCWPSKRPHLCAALRHGTPPVQAMTDSVGTRPATETFAKTSTGGSRETVTIPRPSLPKYPTILYFNISATQIGQICEGIADLGPVPEA